VVGKFLAELAQPVAARIPARTASFFTVVPPIEFDLEVHIVAFWNFARVQA
jgi:hypothetical protein